MYKILCSFGNPPKENHKDVNIDLISENNRNDIIVKIPEYDGYIAGDNMMYDEEFFSAAKNLKVLSRCGVGINNIDLESAKRFGIKVTNVPFGNYISVAEHTIGLMIATAKNFNYHNRVYKKGRMSRGTIDAGIELEGKTLGQMGFGTIGSAVAERCQNGFNMSVLVYDPYVIQDRIDKKVKGKKVDFETLIISSDFITMNLPSTEETRGIINYQTIKKMKNSAIIINTGRGDAIVEDDLVKALNENLLFGVGLDVTQNEPLKKNSLLMRYDNVILTGHTASRTKDAYNRILQAIIKDQLAVLNGDTPEFPVD